MGREIRTNVRYRTRGGSCQFPSPLQDLPSALLCANRHHIKQKLRARSGFDAIKLMLDGFILKGDSAPDRPRFSEAVIEMGGKSEIAPARIEHSSRST